LISSNRAFLKKIDLYVFETIGVSSSYPRVLLILLESTLEESKTTSLREGYKERRFYKIGHCCFRFRYNKSAFTKRSLQNKAYSTSSQKKSTYIKIAILVRRPLDKR